MSYTYGLLTSTPIPTYLPTEIAVPDEVSTRQNEPISEEELLNGEISKRCIRCGVLYKRQDDTNTACHIHVGILVGTLSVPNYWTCCKKLSNETGCEATFHLEDKNARDSLLQYSILTTQAESRRTITKNMLPTGNVDSPKQRVVRADNEPKNGFIIHTVLATDTLEGISLRYEISKNELIKANRGLSTASFPAFRKILIPVGDAQVILTDLMSPEEKLKLEQEKMRVRFAREFKTSSEEASAYLSTHDYDYQLAAQDFRDDVAFESALPNQTSGVNQSLFTSRTTKFTPIPASSPKSKSSSSSFFTTKR